jgi:DNA-binding transcriptional LysR family regulator
MSGLDLHRARTFVAVVAHGSVSAAADALGYTQSAVSQQLSTLERDVGLTLVDRAKRPLRPTPAGAELLPEIEALLARAGAADAAIDDLRGLRRGHVQLATFASALATVLPPLIATFRAERPSLTVGLTDAETDAALTALRTGTADLALIHLMPGQRIEDDNSLARAVLGDDALHAVLPARHRLARRKSLRLKDIATEPLILPSAHGSGGAFRALAERLLADAGGTPNVAYEIDDLRAAQSFAAAGLGIVLMHGLTIAPSPPGVAVRPLNVAGAARRVEVVRMRQRRVPAARARFDELAAHRLASGVAGLGEPRAVSRP